MERIGAPYTFASYETAASPLAHQRKPAKQHYLYAVSLQSMFGAQRLGNSMDVEVLSVGPGAWIELMRAPCT
jgi:hypothetical protein